MVADCCNPIELTRNEWELVALETKARYIHIEVICSDRLEHRRRVETRHSNISGLKLPTWKEVESRRYHQWTRDRIVIDTSGKSEIECFEDLLSKLSFLALLTLGRIRKVPLFIAHFCRNEPYSGEAFSHSGSWGLTSRSHFNNFLASRALNK